MFADPFVMLLAGDFAAVPGKIELTVLLTRVMMPFLILVALAAAAMGMLNSVDRYFVPALAPAVFNVFSILTTIALVPVLTSTGLPVILSVAIGVLVGGLGQFVVQVPSLYREGYRYSRCLDPSEPRLREVLLLMGPGTLGLAATQINMFVNTWLATGEGTGAVSWLAYAYRLMYLPLGLFGVSIATASMPAIARRAAEGDVAGLRKTLSSGIAMMLTLNVPATLGLIVLSHPIVALLFERGRFTAADTAGNRERRDVLCDRSHRLLDREGRDADVLRARRQPDAGRVERHDRARQRSAQHRVRALARLSRPGAGHVVDGAPQCRGADADPPESARRHQRWPARQRAGEARGREHGDGGRGMDRRAPAARCALPGHDLLVTDRSRWRLDRRGARSPRRRVHGCSACRSSTSWWTALPGAFDVWGLLSRRKSEAPIERFGPCGTIAGRWRGIPPACDISSAPAA